MSEHDKQNDINQSVVCEFDEKKAIIKTISRKKVKVSRGHSVSVRGKITDSDK
jgi:hypothetical protein